MNEDVYWTRTPADERDWPTLERDVETDVAIVGGGFVGLASALRLAEAGLRVTVLEARRVGRQATGRSTAKLTSQHGLIYKRLVADVGEEGARLYGERNEAAIAWVAERAVPGSFERAEAHVYAAMPSQERAVREEAEVAARLGLPARFTARIDMPLANHGVMTFADQAAIEPYPLLRGFAASLAGRAEIHEGVRVEKVEHGFPCVVRTAGGHTVKAAWVIVATQIPVIAEGMYFAKAFPHAHPVVAARCDGRGVPDGMFITAGQPKRSFRTARRDGETFIVATGPTFKPGETEAQRAGFRDLEGWLDGAFGIKTVDHRWTNEDFAPMDSLPLVGAANRRTPRMLVATGFNAWGLTNSVVASEILADMVQGRTHPLAKFYDSTRLRPIRGAPTLVSGNVKSGVKLFRDWVLRAKDESLDGLAPGEGRIVRRNGRKLAVSRAPSGEITAVSAVCTHLGCVVGWNPTDRTWDCPCHGSRFETSGEVIAGPAATPLERVALDADAPADASASASAEAVK